MKICFNFTKQTFCNRSFAQADVPFVAYQAGLSFNMDLNSPFRWTPKIQKIEQSPEFLKKMKYFQRLTIMEDQHYSELIDTFLFEALKNTDFDYYYDYKCESNPYCPFYGTVPFLIYNKVNKYPIIPVLRSKPINAFTLVAKEREMLITETVAAGLWALTNSQVQKLNSVRMLQTDGNHWRMLELCKNERFKKTGIYCQENDSYSKIYYDYEVQQIVLGLIRHSLNQMDEKEQALNLIYDFVDERRYLTHEGAPSKPTAKFWKFVPQSIKNFFF
ncbi:unnamed protein product [Paramecium sonneborni]|uniref:Uncharacterized protein n=1 Tax=Paramecium sonneborni TaxID=65129 RepID=A0A8S1R191_9CILI|nr:unnamed protein product [Paramecium sonneborni]